MAPPTTYSPKRRKRVLLIDEDPATAEWTLEILEAEGYDARSALIGTRGQELFRQWGPDAVLVNLTLPDVDGVELARRLKEADPWPEIIALGEPGGASRSMEAMQAGAFYFLQKPVTRDGLVGVLQNAFERMRERAEHQQLKEQVRGQYSFANVVGQSKAMKDLFELIESVAASEANILIQGENGTGKELIANAIHHHSGRVRGPFIKINCAAIPHDLIESELFGYRKGAFTGATVDKVGLLEMAEGGSLLLDEVAEMPAALQTKLLRVLQQREYRPIGSDRTVRVDFRLICSTNVDLEQALREGRVREDLYFRINTITLRVPPLRERTEDIPLICNHFLAKFNQRYERAVRAISPAAYHLLIRNRWSGNVRELENAMERAVLVCKTGEIGPDDLPETLRDAPPSSDEFTLPPGRTLAEIERLAIVQTLVRTNWNKQEAAQMLGLYRPTLYSKMRKHKIVDERAQARLDNSARVRPRNGTAPSGSAGQASR
jgi:DNA-binding NtrC family response regulator